MNDYIKEKCNNIYFNIKSYDDIFLICFHHEVKDSFEIYYLSKNNYLNENINSAMQKIKNEITVFNGDCEIPFAGKIKTYSLLDMNSNLRLAKMTGFVSDSLKYTITRDTDKEYSPKVHPYIMGYHNWNYGNTMLALYLCEVLKTGADGKAIFVPAAPETIRQFHEELNSRYFKKNMTERLKYIYTDNPDEIKKNSTYRIHKKYLKPATHTNAADVRRYQFMSGRYVDIARLNEKQANAGLNRQAGILGYRINDFNIPMVEQGGHKALERLERIIGSIISDTINMKSLFHDKNYMMTLKLKRQLLVDYPELFGNTNHEDFVSYYTILLCNMEAFKNEGLGYDRYEEIFHNKEKFEHLMKDETLPREQRELYSIMRENTKLILTSASGAADVNYNTAIRMNNRILSMRIIGQLFTWRIGQAQALEGAKVISTNTDGLYTIMDEKRNAEILEREAGNIHVGIKPEVTYLVSKDSNNRLEGIYNGYSGNSIDDITVTGAHGGNLSCMNGPVTTKAPDHPVIIDWALAEILKWKALSGSMDEFSDEAGLKLIKETAPFDFPGKREYLRMFQHIISSSPDKYIYNQDER